MSAASQMRAVTHLPTSLVLRPAASISIAVTASSGGGNSEHMKWREEAGGREKNARPGACLRRSCSAASSADLLLL